jgi:hypothetical protein
MLKVCRRISCILLLLASSQVQGADPSPKDQPIDYERLDLSVTLTGFRSGNHDSSGEGQYFLEAKIYGLSVLKEEIKKTFQERQKIERVRGEFGQIQIKNLKFWHPEKKPSPAFTISISGDLLREVVAETMRSFKVSEDQVAILCKVELYERNKKLFLFGENLKVGEAQFFVIPDTLPHRPLIENKELVIEDELGTHVTLQVRFKSLEVKSGS